LTSLFFIHPPFISLPFSLSSQHFRQT